ncbi:MAG: hypothetical protein JRN20_06740 [Nitrososphaerota archaeon]|nr:hypothetical protein [Nitrososphaerota archaeon]MDG6922571.1 hypothetical protein [Nitrososphaerota archaeon]
MDSHVSSSRAVAMIGMFSALYIVSSSIVSFVTQVGYPEHFLRGILMTAVVLWTGRKWSATIMGAVCGLVFLLVVPSPAPYLLASTFVSGLVFDLVLTPGSFAKSIRSTTRVLIGAAVSGAAESLVALSILTYAGFFGTKTLAILGIAWSTDLVLNIILSAVGAIIAIQFLSKKLKTMSPPNEQNKLNNGSDARNQN